jgi:hypothetical protein
MEELSFRWFSLYYLALGTLLITGGGYIFARIQAVATFIEHAANLEHPPGIWVRIVKYFFMFSIPCLIFSFFPFSWPEFIFSIWCMIIVFTTGQLLAQWKHTSRAITENTEQISKKTRFISFNMVSLGFIMFLLFYHLQSRIAI